MFASSGPRPARTSAAETKRLRAGSPNGTHTVPSGRVRTRRSPTVTACTPAWPTTTPRVEAPAATRIISRPSPGVKAPSTDATRGIRRTTLLFNPLTAPYYVSILHKLGTAPAALKTELTTATVQSGPEIELAIAAAAREPGNGLITGADSFIVANRAFIISLAERYQIPAIYQFRQFAADGGLMSYGPDTADIFRRSATYVDRILKGANPADLPVQQPTKFEFVINLKTAKALGLTVSPTLLARADEVIE